MGAATLAAPSGTRQEESARLKVSPEKGKNADFVKAGRLHFQT